MWAATKLRIDMITTEMIIQAALDKFRAPRGEKTIWAGMRRMRVRTAGEKVLFLPNGVTVKVTTDDSGVATQIEENESLHAIARPNGVNLAQFMARSR